MAGGDSIKLFQFTQKFSRLIGIELAQPIHNRYTLNCKNVIFMIITTQLTWALVEFLLHDAKSMGEYGVLALILDGVYKAEVDYFFTIWELQDIFEFIKNCKDFIAKSEFTLFIAFSQISCNVCAFSIFCNRRKENDCI